MITKVFHFSFLMLLAFSSSAKDIRLYFGSSGPEQFAAAQIQKTLKGVSVTSSFAADADIVLITKRNIASNSFLSFLQNERIAKEGYLIKKWKDKLLVIGADSTGTMYGALDVKEQLQSNGNNLSAVQEKKEEPRFSFRAIKFNLPFMAYRASYCLTQQDAIIRDLKFWEAFLNMMAENRFNVLSLWSLHPFHYMVTSKSFPEANQFSEIEMLSWKNFWTQLFRMAHQRGIETYIINWNTFVSPSFARAHKLADYSERPAHIGPGDTSKLIEAYTKETITQVINEYPELDGLGITLGERMGGQNPDERRAWLDRTFFAGMREANRKIKFVYRAPLSANEASGGSTSEENDLKTRKHIEGLDINGPAYLEFKFNWSHGHSSPKLFIVHGGKLTDKYKNPIPEKYRYVWTLRNEDFYILRWGQPDFIREFIKNNGDNYVAGTFLGSEVFIPAMDFTSLPGAHKTWDYHFQRQWLWYALWGRLLYNPNTPDAVFHEMLEKRYGKGAGTTALNAWKHASNNQLWFAAFHMGKADGTLYTEGFCRWSDYKEATFFDINNIITHPVLDTTQYINIKDWVRGGEKSNPGVLSPLQFAQQLDQNNAALLKEINVLKARNKTPGVAVEINDMEAWYWFGKYFSDKIKAGVAVARYRYTGNDQRPKAVKYLQNCVSYWSNYANALAKYNKDEMLFFTAMPFSWKRFNADALKDIELAKENKTSMVNE